VEVLHGLTRADVQEDPEGRYQGDAGQASGAAHRERRAGRVVPARVSLEDEGESLMRADAWGEMHRQVRVLFLCEK
jgi:hypothetical protein